MQRPAPHRHRTTLKPLLLAMAASGLIMAQAALATGFEVRNLNDAGPESLRERIAEANADILGGPHNITFQAGLTGTITLTTGQILIQEAMTITGPGAGLLTISGAGASGGSPSGPSRVFYIEDGLDSSGFGVTIEDLTIANGNGMATSTPADPAGGPAPGGCIFSDSALSLIDSVVSGCTAVDAGGGIYVSGNADGSSAGPYGTLTLALYRSTVSGNTVTCAGQGVGPFGTGWCSGGGVFAGGSAGAPFDLGVLAAKYSSISNNAVVASAGPHPEQVVQTGGGAFAPFAIILASTISGNSLSGDTAVEDDNSNTDDGGLFRFGGGLGAIYSLTYNSTIDNNTIAGNGGSVDGQQLFVGGGIGTIAWTGIFQSTVSGNSVPAGSPGAGVAFGAYAQGGSKYSIVSNSTIANNSGASSLSIVGVYGAPPEMDEFELNSSIVANTVGGVDVYCEAGCDVHRADNLVESWDANVSFDEAPLTADPMLGTLANNGGFSTGAPGAAGTGRIRTHALNASSPAIGQGNIDIDFFGTLEFDERGEGFPRVVGGAADIGAYEWKSSTPKPIPALGPWALGLLSGLVGLLGWRRRRP